jgi:hypothetical protein
VPRSVSQLRFEHILSYRRNWERAYVAAITVYFDDSGTHPTSRLAIGAVWIAPFKMWQRFNMDWERAKKKHGFNCFHISECMANNKDSEFADRAVWDDDKKKTVLARLVQIINMRTVQGFGLAIDKKDYEAVLSDKQREITGKYHYTWAVPNLIGSVERWRVKAKIAEPTEYIFDRMTKGDAKKEIESIFEQAELKADSLHRYGIYKGCSSFRDKCDVLPLQAADIAAWLQYQKAMYEEYGKQPHPLAIKPWDALLDKHFEGSFILRDVLADWVRKESADPKSLLYNVR